LALAAGKHEPARLVRVPEVLALVVRPQRRREGLDQGGEPFPALGQTARRQVEALTAQVFQQPVGGPVKLILVEQDRHPERDTQRALGDPSGRRRWSDDARMHPTGAGGAIAAAADQAAMGLAVAGADGGVVGAREVRERLATVGAALLVGGQGHDFFAGGQVPMVVAAVSGVATLLAAWSAAAWRRRRLGGGVAGRGVAVPVRGRGRVGGQLLGAGTGFGATAEGLLAAETELGVAFGNRLAEDRRALARAGRHRLPVADWLAEGQALGLQGAGVTRPCDASGMSTSNPRLIGIKTLSLPVEVEVVVVARNERYSLRLRIVFNAKLAGEKYDVKSDLHIEAQTFLGFV